MINKGDIVRIKGRLNSDMLIVKDINGDKATIAIHYQGGGIESAVYSIKDLEKRDQEPKGLKIGNKVEITKLYASPRMIIKQINTNTVTTYWFTAIGEYREAEFNTNDLTLSEDEN